MDNKDKTYYKRMYEKLRKQYTDKELAEAFVFPPDMDEEEKKKADEEFWEFRRKQMLNRTSEEKILSSLLSIKYHIEDYAKERQFDEGQGVGHYLHEYMNAVNRKQKELAEDIDIHPTRLSRILNGKERLSLSVAYRLEKHSGGTIPAILWWRLVQKEIEQEIRADKKMKEKEMSKVKNVALHRA